MQCTCIYVNDLWINDYIFEKKIRAMLRKTVVLLVFLRNWFVDFMRSIYELYEILNDYFRTMFVFAHLGSPTLITAAFLHRNLWNLTNASLPYLSINLVSLFIRLNVWFLWTNFFSRAQTRSSAMRYRHLLICTRTSGSALDNISVLCFVGLPSGSTLHWGQVLITRKNIKLKPNLFLSLCVVLIYHRQVEWWAHYHVIYYHDW